MTRYAKTRISNPAGYFKTPSHVLCDNRLSPDDKANVLMSMALDADLMVEATSEGMAGADPGYNALDLQSALIQLEKTIKPENLVGSSLQNARFQRIMVVTTTNQDLNREIADVAFDMAETVGGKVYLLNVIPSALEGAGLAAAGHMGTVIPLGTTDATQIVENRKQQLADLTVEIGSSVETEIEVRSGQIGQVIVYYVDDCNADIIVVGAPNRSWLETLFGTSTAHSVTKAASCPVLVVPEPA